MKFPLRCSILAQEYQQEHTVRAEPTHLLFSFLNEALWTHLACVIASPQVYGTAHEFTHIAAALAQEGSVGRGVGGVSGVGRRLRLRWGLGLCSTGTGLILSRARPRR